MAKKHYKSDYTTIGRLAKPFALKGEVKALSMSFDFFRFKKLCKEASDVILFDPDTGNELISTIDKAYPKKEQWFLHFKDINSPEEIGQYTNWEILVSDSERLELPEGMFYFSDLADLNAIDFDGNDLNGKVIEARENTSNDIIIFKINGKEVVAPWIEECIGKIDLKKGTIELNLDFLGEVYEV